MKTTPSLPQITLLAVLFSYSFAVVGAGAVVESQPSTPGQGSNSANDNTSNNSDGLLLLLEQNRNLQAEVQALRALVEEQGYEVRKLQRESMDRYTDMDSRLGSLEGALTSGSAPVVSTEAVTPRVVEVGEELPSIQSTATNTDQVRNPVADSVAIASRSATTQPPKRDAVEPIDVLPATPEELIGVAANNPSAARSNTMRPAIEPAVLSEQQLYQMAYDSAINSQFDRAIMEFDQYLNLYPSGRFTTNAHYWKGQAYLYLSQYAQAIASYTIILEQYADSAKIPDATYGLGVAYEGMGDTQRARQLFREIKSKYPNTGVANLADTRLLSLD